MSNDNAPQPITLMPSDVLGIIQRRLLELNAYLGQAPMGVDVGLAKQHFAEAYGFLENFEQMQAAIIKQQSGAAKEMTN